MVSLAARHAHTPASDPLGVWEREYTAEMLPTVLLGIDHSYQRPLSMATVRKYAEEWNRTRAEAIRVCQRPDGSYYIVDGQHRHKAAMMVGEVVMDCHVYRFPSVEVEASMFRHWNADVRKTGARDSFRAAIREGDEEALAIAHIAEECGFTVVLDGTQGARASALGSVSTIRSIYTSPGGEERLPKVLRLAKRTWGDKPGAASRVILSALDGWLRRYDGHYDDRRFVQVIGTAEPTRDPRHLSAISNNKRERGRSGAHDAALLCLWDVYNHRLSSKRLPHPFGLPTAKEPGKEQETEGWEVV